LEVEAGERPAEGLALLQDRQPAQPRLEALEAELLEEAPVVAHRPAPLVVVVREVERVLARPPAALHARSLACRPSAHHAPGLVSYLGTSPIAFAHRGGAALWPENTLAAFEGALSLGYRYIETDVHITKDGRIVCFHDETLDRTTDGRGPLAALTLDQLRELDAGYRLTSHDGRDGEHPFRGKGLTVPTLEEALALDPDLRLNLEIKPHRAKMER